MKKAFLLSTLLLLSASAVFAAEPLLLEPLSPTVLSTTPGVNVQTPQNAQAVNVNTQTETTQQNANGPQITFPEQSGVYEATFTPRSKIDSNMVPQNAAAEGKQVPERREPRVRVQTKQRSQGNAYWNAGGKGTKSFF